MIGFDERRLLAAASQQLNVGEVLEPAFLPAFRALLTGLREQAQLSAVGAWRAGARLMAALGQRVALAQFEHDTPELSAVELMAPIFVTGPARASTRLLHDLLARLPGTWAPRLWELQRPVPPARIDERFIDRQIHTTEILLEQLWEAAPELRRLQPQAATATDSCSWLFRNSFSSLAHALTWYMPSYVEFMRSAELGPAYRDHRRFVRVLAHRHRHDDHAGPRVVLEDPWHQCHLDALLAAYPDAWVVRVHTPHEQVLDELARRCWTLQQVDAKRPRTTKQMREYCAQLLADPEDTSVQTLRVIDIDAAELAADPIALLTRLAPRLQLRVSAAALAGASRWLADQRTLAHHLPAQTTSPRQGLLA